jgi:hypothetical protein
MNVIKVPNKVSFKLFYQNIMHIYAVLIWFLMFFNLILILNFIYVKQLFYLHNDVLEFELKSKQENI